MSILHCKCNGSMYRCKSYFQFSTRNLYLIYVNKTYIMSAVQTCLCFTIHVQWTFWRMFQLQVVIWNIIFKVMVIFFCHARVNFQLFSLFSIWNHVFDLPTSDSPDKFQNESEEEDEDKKNSSNIFFPL